MAETMRVLPGPKLEPGRVALWETHPDHPDGEVFVAAPHPGDEPATPVRVAMTSLVNEKLGAKLLVEAGRSQSPVESPEPAPTPTPAAAVLTAPTSTRESRGRG